MRHAPSTSHFSHAFRRSGLAGAIEWEELPSLAARLRASNESFTASAPWDSTRPATLDTVSAPMPFREPLQGVAVRETSEPDIFRHFFGR
ncbi:MAG: hypothetical protein ABIO71_10205 [Caldimonas sp.]